MENLEYEIRKPEKLQYPLGMVICHPHPQFGGDFKNIVVRKLEKFCSQIIPTLRFNFRGVGSSSGSYSDGIGEKDDVEQMIGVLLEKIPDISQVIVAGYSFGAAVGCSVAAKDQRVSAYIAVAFPFTMFTKHAEQSNCSKPKLFITGDDDDFTPLSEFEKWYAKFDEPKEKVIIPAMDHFFASRSDEVGIAAKEFIIKNFS
jgi:alpha/beta superfamily hydrolase